jgi:hypothetical protein
MAMKMKWIFEEGRGKTDEVKSCLIELECFDMG